MNLMALWQQRELSFHAKHAFFRLSQSDSFDVGLKFSTMVTCQTSHRSSDLLGSRRLVSLARAHLRDESRAVEDAVHDHAAAAAAAAVPMSSRCPLGLPR